MISFLHQEHAKLVEVWRCYKESVTLKLKIFGKSNFQTIVLIFRKF